MDPGSLVPAPGHNLPEPHSSFAAELNRPLTPLFHGLPSQDSVLRDYYHILRKRIWVVVTCMAVIFGVVAVATLHSTPIYDASGSIKIDKTDPMMLNFKDSQGGGIGYYDPTDMDTEVRILRSDLLALQVIKQLDLDKQPEYGGQQETSLGLEQTTDALQPDSPRTSGVLMTFKNNLTVSLVPGTRIIEIHYRSPDKNRAAQVVNSLMHTYVEQNFKSRFESTMQASDWLQQQLVDLKIKVETSQEKLVKYQKEHDILGIDEKQNIITSKLDELNKGLTQAESDRMEKESIYRLLQSNNGATVVASGMNGNDSAEQRQTTSLLDKLREQQADLKIQAAQLSTQFGPSYPKVAQLNNQLKEIEAQIQQENLKVLAQVRGDYLAALQRENMLGDAMEKQKQEANQLNESAIEYSLLKRDVETYRALYEGLQERLKEAGVTAGLRSNNIRIVDAARAPNAPAEPNIPRNLAFALALGLTTGIGMAFVMEALDNTVRTPEQAQVVSALPSLGMIPLGTMAELESGEQPRLSVASSQEAVELVTQSRPHSQMAESYRALRTSLLLSSLGAPPKVILITSALPQEGKTTTSLNTAIVLAQKGSRVLLIDADLRRPSVHKTLGMGPRTGLSNVLTGSVTLTQAVVRTSLLPTLFVLPAGTPPPNPAELLASTNMNDVLTELREQYDHIVIDTPPTLSVTDAVVMSTRADTVVLVIRSGQTTRQALRRARDLLVRVNARISGVLLNAADLKSADYYYYYEYRGKYGSRYYQEEDAPSSGEGAEAKETVPKIGSGTL